MSSKSTETGRMSGSEDAWSGAFFAAAAAEAATPPNGPLPPQMAEGLYDPMRARQMSVLVWHWGRVGAGPKFTFEIARALGDLPRTAVSVSASAGSDLDALCGAGEISLDRVQTFGGRKGSARSNLNAMLGLLGIPTLAADFARTLAERRPDVVLCAFQSIWDVAAIQAMRRFSGRFVLILHDATFHPGDDYPLRAKVLAREVAAADALIVLSDHVGTEAGIRFSFPADRIWKIPHGAFSFGDSRKLPRRHPRHRAFRILFLGRILDYKGLWLLLEAYKLLRDRGLSVVLNIAGEGDMLPYADAIKRMPGIEIDNRWLDEIEIGDHLARADIVVLPYVEASQSGVAAAAMTAAVPVVVTPVGGLAEQVMHEETGLVASSVKTVALADAIQRLVIDAALYEHCSEGALRYARDELSWSAIAEKVRRVLDDVTKRPRRAAK